jgi:hypothetical protein
MSKYSNQRQQIESVEHRFAGNSQPENTFRLLHNFDVFEIFGQQKFIVSVPVGIDVERGYFDGTGCVIDLSLRDAQPFNSRSGKFFTAFQDMTKQCVANVQYRQW